MSLDCDAWVLALWKHFRSEIASGAPLYLSVDRHLIKKLYSPRDRVDDAVANFHASCLSLLKKRTDGVELLEHAFQRMPGRPHSRVIVLAVQQVLVVEDMLSDDYYSEQSYFPRYRRVLGLSGQNENSSPIKGTVFARIWSVLKDEIEDIEGANTCTVTFTAGKGRDLNRQYPLSQALLTTHDLTVLHERVPWLTPTANTADIRDALLKVRSQLGLRARRLLAAALSSVDLAERLATQVRAFLGSSLRSRLPQKLSGSIVGYLQTADPFDFDDDADTYKIHYQTRADQTDGTILTQALEDRLRRQDFIPLVSHDDCFREWDGAPASIHAVLLIVRAGTSSVDHSLSFSSAKSDLPPAYDVLLSTSGRIGEWLLSLQNTPQRDAIELVGGLLADARSRIYLSGYPPNGVRYRGQLLSSTEALKVNDEEVQVGDWLKDLESAEDAAYTISRGENRITMTIATSQHVSDAKIGFPIRGGELDLVLQLIESGKPHLRGTRFVEANVDSRLSKRDLIALVNRGRRFKVSEDELAALLLELRVIAKQEDVAALALRLVEATGSIPVSAMISGVLQRLQRS